MNIKHTHKRNKSQQIVRKYFGRRYSKKKCMMSDNRNKYSSVYNIYNSKNYSKKNNLNFNKSINIIVIENTHRKQLILYYYDLIAMFSYQIKRLRQWGM